MSVLHNLVFWTFPMSHFKANLKNNDNKASPCFRTFWIRNVSNKCLPIWTFIQPLPAFCNSYIAKYPAQVEFWARHNWMYIMVIMHVHTRESSWNPALTHFECDQPQNDSPTACVTDLKYSSATFISLCFHSHKENIS